MLRQTLRIGISTERDANKLNLKIKHCNICINVCTQHMSFHREFSYGYDITVEKNVRDYTHICILKRNMFVAQIVQR